MPKRVHRTLVVLSVLATMLLGAALCEARPAARPAASPTAPTGTSTPPTAPPVAGVVNLNTATEEQLQLLPRVGPAKAQAILKYRSRAKFKNPWDLTHVKGIGRKSFRWMRPYLAVQGETTLTTKVKLSRE